MSALRVCIVGTGYVGLTNAVALAYLGNQVTCLDVEAAKIASLSAGKIPIFEPHLDELLAAARSRLTFTTSYADAIPSADVVFIAVGTPTGEGGAPDLRYLESAARAVGENLGEGFTVIVNKSTVPIGSANWVDSLVRDAYEAESKTSSDGRFAVASNPSSCARAPLCTTRSTPIAPSIGADDARALEVLTGPLSSGHRADLSCLRLTFFAPRVSPRCLSSPPIAHRPSSSSTRPTRFSRSKISFINEIAELAERVGADVGQMSRGIGSDARIGKSFLHAGHRLGRLVFRKGHRGARRHRARVRPRNAHRSRRAHGQ